MLLEWSCNKFLSLRNIIYVFFCKNFSVISVIFTQKLKKNNSAVRFQERIIPVKYSVGALNYSSSFFLCGESKKKYEREREARNEILTKSR